MAQIELTNVTKRWGAFYAVDSLNLKIDDNAFVTLLGPSGCGKTTTLRMIAGLETPTSGRITIDGTPVFDSELGVNVPANHRRVGFLFQNYALWPNMTVYQNIAFGLSNMKEKIPDVDWEAREAEAIARVLSEPDDLAALLADCRSAKGGLDNGKALLRLIDQYELSRFTAKKILDLHLDAADDPRAVAAAAREKQLEIAKRQRERAAAAGAELNERCEFVRGAEVRRRHRKMNREEIDLVVRRVSRVVKIGTLLDRYPSELSGGQQQRVAIARTLAPEPKVLFMDEPLSNLDAKLRLEMRSELQRLHLETGSTFIYVTHDQMEAMTLATKICLINNGVLQQYDEPMNLYNYPTNLFAADFVGSPSINFIAADGRQQADGSLELSMLGGAKGVFSPRRSVSIPEWMDRADAQQKAAQEAAAARRKGVGEEKSNKDTAFKPRFLKVDDEDYRSVAAAESAEFVIGVRPEAVDIHEGGALEGEIFSAMPAGMETTVRIRLGNFLLTGVIFGGVVYKIGQKVKLDLAGGSILLFSSRNGRLISEGELRFL